MHPLPLDLPVRLESEAGSEPVVSVDGYWGAPGLNLSHWPGNTTPSDLKHDLSTGIALRFSRLEPADQALRTAGCKALCNNHIDTDGVCSMFVLTDPERAWQHEDALLAAARAGDFFQLPNEEAFVLDAIVTGISDVERSPWRERFEGLSERERHELCTHGLLERLPDLLAGENGEFRGLWEPRLEDLRADLADLRSATLDDLVHLSLSVWTAAPGATSSRAPNVGFDPGRHALFGTRESDRHLVVGPAPGPHGGTTYRFLIGTLSWFDLVSPAPPPRPDLPALAAALNRLEGTGEADTAAWRHQSPMGASPELWFGTSRFPSFSEHAEGVLKESELDPTLVKATVVEALRTAWVFPDDGDDTDID